MSLHTISIKVDQKTAQMLARLPNRSEFIRNALMEAIQPRCPLCDGRGKKPTGHPLAEAYSDFIAQQKRNTP